MRTGGNRLLQPRPRALASEAPQRKRSSEEGESQATAQDRDHRGPDPAAQRRRRRRRRGFARRAGRGSSSCRLAMAVHPMTIPRASSSFVGRGSPWKTHELLDRRRRPFRLFEGTAIRSFEEVAAEKTVGGPRGFPGCCCEARRRARNRPANSRREKTWGRSLRKWSSERARLYGPQGSTPRHRARSPDSGP